MQSITLKTIVDTIKMENFIGFLITNADYTTSPKHIKTVTLRKRYKKDNSNFSQEVGKYSRQTVIEILSQGVKINTALYNEEKKQWKIGAPVLSYERNGKEWIKSEANDIEEDNLGELPCC